MPHREDDAQGGSREKKNQWIVEWLVRENSKYSKEKNGKKTALCPKAHEEPQCVPRIQAGSEAYLDQSLEKDTIQP